MNEFNISGTYIWYYCICKREVWLLAHALEADQQDENMQIGNIIHEISYSRSSKEVGFGHSKFDIISKDNGKLVVGEIKKSSRFVESSRMQLLFYLKELSDNNIDAEGILMFPDEKRREVVQLDEDSKEKLENIINDIKQIVSLEQAPPPIMIKYCKKCAYAEFCWA